MKTNHLITAALLSLGLISSASASGTFGTTNIVYITGSTAFRGNLFNALTTTTAAPTVFDVGSTVVTEVSGGGAATGSSSTYNAIGPIGGTPTIISVALTGSEAGLAALQGSTITYAVVANPEIGKAAAGNVTLAGTPLPSFLLPFDPTGNSTATATASPDFSFADTSKAVSLSSGGTFTDYGIVGVVPFTWAKGTNSVPDNSWHDLVNVSIPQLQTAVFAARGTSAGFFTSTTNDLDKVYVVGRNEGSGTRVNMLLSIEQPVGKAVQQFAPNNSTYGGGGNILTVGAVTPFTANSILKNNTGIHLVPVANDGFDSGSGVSKTLNYDLNGQGFITLGYLGLGDAETLVGPFLATTSNNGQWLTLDGEAETDANVYSGSYSFWGHEHLYGAASLSTIATTVGSLIAGGTNPNGNGLYNQSLEPNWYIPNGAIEAHGNLSVPPAAFPNNSTALSGTYMQADKPSGGDSGFPAPGF